MKTATQENVVGTKVNTTLIKKGWTRQGQTTPKKVIQPKKVWKHIEEKEEKEVTRNTNEYTFEKQKRGKGRTVLAVVQAFVRDNDNVNLQNLLKTFPRNTSYDTVERLKKAIQISTDPAHPRYFMQDAITVKMGNAKVQVVVTNQWTVASFDKFVVIAKSLGYTIK